jgi:hypothetical protein
MGSPNTYFNLNLLQSGRRLPSSWIVPAAPSGRHVARLYARALKDIIRRIRSLGNQPACRLSSTFAARYALTVPLVQRLAVEDLYDAGVLVEVDRIGLAKTAGSWANPFGFCIGALRRGLSGLHGVDRRLGSRF